MIDEDMREVKETRWRGKQGRSDTGLQGKLAPWANCPVFLEGRQQGIQILHILTPGAMPWQPHHSIPPYANVSNIPFLYSTSHPPPSRPQFTRQTSYAIHYWQVYPPMTHFNFMTSVLTVLKTIISRLKRNTISRTAKPCNHVCSIENSNNHSHENDAILHTGNIHTMLSLSLQGNDCNSSTVINVIPLPIP